IIGLVELLRIAIDDVPPIGCIDMQRNRRWLAALDVHEERCTVPVRVQRVEHAECSGQIVAEYAIVSYNAMRSAGINAPQRSVLAIPFERLSVTICYGELLHVLGEIHARVPSGGPHRH